MAITALQTQTTLMKPALPQPQQDTQPVPANTTAASHLNGDSVSVSKQPKLGESVKEGVKFETKLGAKLGAAGGAIAGGVAVPLLTYAFTMGAPLRDPKIFWGSLAVGVVGGAAVGAGLGAAHGALSGAVNGVIVSTTKSKTQAQLATAALAGASNLAYDLYKGKSLPTALVSSAVTAGIAGMVGGVIYERAIR